LEYYNTRVATARAACGHDVWTRLVAGYRNLFQSLKMWGDPPARMAILYPGANGLPSTFYVDGEARQILLLQAVEQLHAKSDTLRPVDNSAV
jgi:hypothetical protein